MPLLFLSFVGLTTLGALSPLLTFAALFQQKEWRMDRLMEHLRREGIFRQLWGRLRPALAAVFLGSILSGIWMMAHTADPEEALSLLVTLIRLELAWLLLFGGLTTLQLILRRQRRPRWTTKAILIVALAVFLTTVLAFFSAPILVFAPLLLLMQPFIVLLSWAVLLPLDRLLKNRTFRRAAAARRRMRDATVIGIAGSVGKTTTKELLKCVLQDLSPLVTPEHVNTEMGVAQWIISQNAKCEMRNANIVLIEMGAYRKGEIALMCSFVKPTIGVMTALGSDHLALFGSEENIVEANGELINALPKDGHAFFYGNNHGSETLAAQAPCPATITGHGDLKAEQIVEDSAGITFSMLHSLPGVAPQNGAKNGQFSIPLHGRHNIGNVLLAIAVARHLGIKDERIKELLQSFHPLSHTFHVHRKQGITVVDDTYNSSRLSIRAALDWAKNRTERPRVLLMSGLLETGTEEEAFLEELGTIAKDSVERVVFTADTNAAAFEKGFVRPVEQLNQTTERVAPGSLLLAIGRMPLSNIELLLSPEKTQNLASL